MVNPRFPGSAWLILGSLLLPLGGCQVTPRPEASAPSHSATQPDLAAQPEPAIASSQAPVPAALEEDATLGINPEVNPSQGEASEDALTHSLPTEDPSLPTLPLGNVPIELVPTTTETERVPQVRQGRNNPFASLPTTPYVVLSPTRTAQPPAANSLMPVPIAQTVPTVPVAGAPPAVVPVPLTVPPAPNNAVPIPSGVNPSGSTAIAGSESNLDPSASPVPAAAPTLEFTGVVQLGDRVSLIVKEPGAASSRYVQVGDRIANGQFVIKAVDFDRGPTPAVILDQAGTESVHWIGSSLGSIPGG
ncbi:MAG: hypothetical protein AB4042_06400 [Leptolyngbyaceae cyanobacterium]